MTLQEQIAKDAAEVALIPQATREALERDFRIACGWTPWLEFPERLENPQ